MKLFECQRCGQLLYFENTRCERCGHLLGYLTDRTILSAVTAEGGDRWRPLAGPDEPFRFFVDAIHDACNWLVPTDGPEPFCRACRLKRTIPDLDAPENLLLSQRLEAAKHRLVYGLLRVGLPLVSKFEDPQRGSDSTSSPTPGLCSRKARRSSRGMPGACNHRNLPIEIVALFSQDILQPFDAAA